MKFGGATLAAWGMCCLDNPCCKTNTECYFYFLPFFVKVNILFGVFWLTKTGTNVGFFYKSSDVMQTFETQEILTFVTGTLKVPNIWLLF